MTMLYFAIPFLTAGIGFAIAKRSAKTTRAVMNHFDATAEDWLREERTIRRNYYLIAGGGFIGGVISALCHFFG